MELTRRVIIGIAALALLRVASVQAQDARTATHLDQVIKAAGVPIVGVSIGDAADKTTWRVQPPTLQTAAQPIIDAFDPTNPVYQQADLDTAVKAALDNERLMSAIVWAVIDTTSPPATRAKYLAARQKIIDSYKTRPWAP